MAVNPFPSLTKRPLPMPHTETGRTTMSFYPDRPVFWEQGKAEKYAMPEDARIRPLKPGSSGTVLQGMLFKPETLEEHWDTPERHVASSRLNIQTNVGFEDSFDDQHIRDTVRRSRMPTSLIHEVADADIKMRPGYPANETYGGAAGVYRSADRTLYTGYSSHQSGVVTHELGHAMHDWTGRANTVAKTPYGNNRTQVVIGASDPLWEGIAEGIGRRYATDKPFTGYDNPSYHGWYGKGGHELYSQVKESVSSTGHIPLINPRLLHPIFDRQKETAEQVNEKVYDRVRILTANTNPEYSDEAIDRKVKENNRVMRGWTDKPMHQPTLWD